MCKRIENLVGRNVRDNKEQDPYYSMYGDGERCYFHNYFEIIYKPKLSAFCFKKIEKKEGSL